VLRREDDALLKGGNYLTDRALEGAAHVVYVRSPMAHAEITAIDISEAAAAPGVLAVITADDLEMPNFPPMMPNFTQGMYRPWLAKDRARFAFEAVAAVVAETREQATDAAELVVVDYNPLPVVVGPEEAAKDEVLLFPEAGTNTVMEIPLAPEAQGDAFFEGCDVVVRQKMISQRLASCPLEVQCAAAFWEGDRMIMWANTQTPHTVRDILAGMYGQDPGNVRVIVPPIGGGFGSKFASYPEALLMPWLARKVQRPVRWVETRTESMMGLGHGRAQWQDVEIGGTRDGKVLAYRLHALQDTGAFPLIGAALPGFTMVVASAVYDTPKLAFSCKSVLTNTAPIVAYRGAGRPEATTAFERIIDMYAAEIGMDPAEVRRKNLLEKSEFPYTTPTGTVYDTGDYITALDKALEVSKYSELRKEQQQRRESGDPMLLGIGISTYVEITSPLPGGEFGEVEIAEDGKAIIRSGAMAFGQGHDTAFSMIVSDRLGIPMDDITVIQGDTDAVAAGVGSFGSRSLQLGGSALDNASKEVLAKAKETAANLLEANPDDVVVEEGKFFVAGTPSVSKSWADVAAAAGAGTLKASDHFQEAGPSFPFGTHICVVEVDTETGAVKLRQFFGVDDAGTIMNPMLLEGQLHGGMAQGIAQALFEEFQYDADGNPMTANLADYLFPSAAELISYDLTSMETPSPNNPLGAKGIGESGTIGSTPAVWNAVLDALAPLGVKYIDMPTTPQKVWAAIQAAQS
jgi:carbon-monoxide dehydrogenase large subunit